MNKEEDYASESDQSDADFSLENENADATSSGDDDIEEDDDAESDGENCDAKQNNRSKQSKANASSVAERTTRQTVALTNGRKASTKEKDELESDEEEDKSRSDALWADFLSDVGESSKAEIAQKVNTSAKETPAKQIDSKKSASRKEITEILDFAGEQVVVKKLTDSSSVKENQSQASGLEIVDQRDRGVTKRPADRAATVGGGLGSLLNQLGKKKKMSVLEKSQLDWKTFKSDEGIDEELQTHNKGKDGYLDRQDFLQRTDIRQFEIEKNLRQARRQN